MKEVAQGETELFELVVKTGGALTDLDDVPAVEILDPGLDVIASGAGTRISLGRYRFAFSAAIDATVGEGWSVSWTGEADAVPVVAAEDFAVVEPATGPTDLLATVPELELYLDEELDAERAAFLLGLASGEVRAATGTEFTYTEADPILLSGKGSTVLLLPQLPVIDVLELVEAPGRLDELELDGPAADRPHYEWSEDGILRRIDGNVFARRFRYYLATYSHGYRIIPEEVRAVVVRCAAGAYENPEGTRQETLGRYSYTVAGNEAGVGLYHADLLDLEPYMNGKRPRSGTVAVGSGS